MSKKDTTITPEMLKKAMADAYLMGRKHEEEKSPFPSWLSSSPEAIEMLSKSIDGNARKINEQILDNHRKAVTAHMEAWNKDASKALDSLLELAEHKHGKK